MANNGRLAKSLLDKPTSDVGVMERLFAQLKPVDGRPGQRACDLRVSSFNIRIVFSQVPTVTSMVAFPRWSWTVPKETAYDYLLLIGEKPGRFIHLYSDPAATSLFFLVPGSAASGLVDRFQTDQICLFVHPEAMETKGHDLAKRWNVRQDEIEEAFANADF